MTDGKQGAPALDDVSTKQESENRSKADSPKPHGDKLGVAGSAAAEVAASSATPGDSPKRHGDELKHAVTEAAKR